MPIIPDYTQPSPQAVPKPSSGQKKTPAPIPVKINIHNSGMQDIKLPENKPEKKLEKKQERKVAEQKPLKIKRSHKKVWLTGIVVVLILLGLGLYAGLQAKTLYTSAQGAKAELTLTASAVKDQKYIAAKDHLKSAGEYLSTAQAASGRLWWLKWLPWVHTQFLAVDNLLTAGVDLSSAGQDILIVVNNISSVISSDNVSINSISDAQRKQLLQQITESPDQLSAAQKKLEAALVALEQLPTHGVVAPLQAAIIPIQDNLPSIETAVHKAIPFLRVAPIIAGYPDQQTYLFLLENNTELRPTGGFIGTYGELQLKDGAIQQFNTDNIYNLDNGVKSSLHVDPPGPLAQYLGSTQWFMRDSNWDPNFPTAAAQVEQFYHWENGPVDKFDGVIAVTPALIADLFKVTGSIVVDGDTYDSNNLTSKLEQQVESSFRQEGISDANRKDVIGKMAHELMSRVMSLPKSQWGQLGQILLDNLEQKHILIYSKNSNVQTLAGQFDWDGSVQNPTGDFMMVVDANVGALKTDQVMTKQINYSLSKSGSDYVADVTLNYIHNGVQNDKTITRYRTFTRIYLPEGSQLQSADGFLTTDRYLGGDPTQPNVTTDDILHKTVVAGFISVEAKTTGVVHLRYTLPVNVAQQITDGTYQLLVEKQAGTDNVSFSLDADIGRAIKTATPLDKFEFSGKNKVRFASPLTTDQELTITY